MKIIERKTKQPFWAGIKGECSDCGSIFESEREDSAYAVFIGYTCIALQCSECDRGLVNFAFETTDSDK